MLLLYIAFVLVFQAANPFELPIVGYLGAALIGPTKIAVDAVRGAIPRLPDGAVPLIGVVLAFGIATLYELATGAAFTGSVYAQCALAALIGQGGAMLATAQQKRTEAKVKKAKGTADV